MGLLDMLTQGGGGGFLDWIMPGPSKNPYGGVLSDEMYQMWRRQQFSQNIRSAGEFLTGAASGNYSAGGGVGQGMGGLLDLMKYQKYGEEREDRQAKRQNQSRWAERFGGQDPINDIYWDTGRQLPKALPTEIASSGAAPGAPGQTGLLSSYTPQQKQALGLLGYEAGAPLLAKRALQTPKAPTVQGFYDEGTGREYKGQWDPTTRQWERVGGLKSASGDLTLAQQSSNTEIDQARATLDRKGLSKDEVYRRTQKATNTGRPNTEYDEALDRIVRIATQRKTGPDEDYRRYFETYLGGVELSGPAGMRPLPPGVSTEEPGLFQRGYDYLFGGDDAAAATGNPLIPPPQPSVGTTTGEPTTPRPISPRGPRGYLGRAPQEAKTPPRLPNGGIDRSRLVTGQVYLHPVDGQAYRWTGTEFVFAR